MRCVIHQKLPRLESLSLNSLTWFLFALALQVNVSARTSLNDLEMGQFILQAMTFGRAC
ncbi:MAG: hypothetical protein ABI557_15960 [Aureliella sp.]